MQNVVTSKLKFHIKTDFLFDQFPLPNLCFTNAKKKKLLVSALGTETLDVGIREDGNFFCFVSKRNTV